MSVRHLDRFFSPRAVAVIGASDRPRSVGATVWRNMRASGYAGALHPVNPSHDELDGVAVLHGIAELPAGVDLALVCTPPSTIPDVVADLAARGVKTAIVMTGIDPVSNLSMIGGWVPSGRSERIVLTLSRTS